MKKIAVISNNSGYFNATVSNRLKEEYDVIEVKANPEEVNEIPIDTNAWLIFLDQEIFELPQSLTFMNEKAMEDEVPVFLIGGKKEIEERAFKQKGTNT